MSGRSRSLRRTRSVALLGAALLLAAASPLAAQDTGSGTTAADGTAPASESATPSILVDLQRALRAVADAALQVVVKLDTEATGLDGPGSQSRPELPVPGVGSGVLVRRDGDRYYVLTNNHVVAEAERITVTLSDERSFAAEVVGTDERIDLAVISFEASADLPLADLGDSDSLHAGDLVLAVGSPFGLEATVTSGIVSAVGRSGGAVNNISAFIQTDANINPGNSGGALVDIFGQVIGINTWIQAQRGRSVGVGFALPINNAKPVIDQLIEVGNVRYAWLGVSIGGPDVVDYLAPGRQGAVLFDIFDGQPAARAGLQPGDVVLAVAGREIGDSDELVRAIGALEPEAPAAFLLLRDGAEQTVMVSPGLRGDDQDSSAPWPGLRVLPMQELTAQAQEELPDAGVFVMRAAAESGVRPRDTIVRVDGAAVADLRDFYRLINAKRDGVFVVQVQRDGRTVTVRVER